MIKLRFSTNEKSILSKSIALQGRFWATHVDAVLPTGLLLGAHIDGGVMARVADYDKGRWTKQLFVYLPADQAMANLFYAFLWRCIGMPYDLGAILGFATFDHDPAHRDHQMHHVICSALQVLALRDCSWFEYPLAVGAHEISPRDLLLLLSGRVFVGEPEDAKE